jgi:hypothetical protein
MVGEQVRMERGNFHEPQLLDFSDKQTGIGRPEWSLGFWLPGFYK